MDAYADIRPYHDHEVRPVLDRLTRDPECIAAVTRLSLPRLPQRLAPLVAPVVRWALRRQTAGIHSVQDFQQLVERYLARVIDTTTSGLQVSGMEHLHPGQAYLFISNHRDIALDPALLNYALFHAGQQTVRIAIGDNLLSKPFVSDLMRLNKSFIVKRSATAPKQMLAALKTLSGYIRHSLQQDGHSIWIAQREGRAKDGNDRTEPAVIKMISISMDRKREHYPDFVRGLRIVPVSISYEYDPCDLAKARELHAVATQGGYQKSEHEDVSSIAAGISGQKGRIALRFSAPLDGEYASPEDVAEALDQHIIRNYVLHPSNLIAHEMLHGAPAAVALGSAEAPFSQGDIERERPVFKARIEAMPEELRAVALSMYARPIASKQQLAG